MAVTQLPETWLSPLQGQSQRSAAAKTDLATEGALGKVASRSKHNTRESPGRKQPAE